MRILQPMENNYQAFLLRLQRAENNGRWRSSLQNVQTGETFHFATEQEMIAHLLVSLAQVKFLPTVVATADMKNQRLNVEDVAKSILAEEDES